MEVRTPTKDRGDTHEAEHNSDQKKGSADRETTGSKKGMPGGDIGRNSMSGGESRHSSGKLDYGGGSDSRERRSAPSSSGSRES